MEKKELLLQRNQNQLPIAPLVRRERKDHRIAMLLSLIMCPLSPGKAVNKIMTEERKLIAVILIVVRKGRMIVE